ncbi:sensor histidine kinase [Nodularia sp. NIES-3585]|uniref:sensor histidine kinase n=1 Tax=Nodularia sp. NIES-3585 TaxID=1973477 RepID=UPI000B5C5264|nr:ATP-binding protein [Nodularia sp. NIES-3585]GAX34956.1 periplasmic sensor signal transduction histidine kinase [Nodularia sp. NIES-3585]
MKNTKIVNKLILWFLIIALLPLTKVTCLNYYIASSSQKKESENNLIAMADNKAKWLENYINERKNNATAITQIPNIIDAVEKYQRVFERFGINSQAYEEVDAEYKTFIGNYLEIFGYSDIFLISQAGDAIFSVKRDPEFGSNFYTGTYKDYELAKVFDRAKTLMQVEISNFGYHLDPREPVAFIAAPIFKGEIIIGVLVLKLNNQEFNKVVNNYIGLGKTGETIVVSQIDETIVFTSPTRHDPNAAFNRTINVNQQKSYPLNQASQGMKGFGITLDYRGQKTIAAWRYLPSLNSGLLVKMDTAEAFASLNTLRNIIIILIIITLILVIFAAIVVAKSISKPVIELTDVVKQLAKGNFYQKAQVITNDEIGQLAKSFNYMAENLEESFETIKLRELELAAANEKLAVLLTDLEQKAQQLATQLIQSEKMSSLGQLVAGVAHEINNPVSFIYGNIYPAKQYIQDLLKVIQIYQQSYPHPIAEIQQISKDIDLDFVVIDLPKLITSIEMGAKRITEIVLSLRNFSRLDEAEIKPVNIHEGIDSTLMILANRLKANFERPEIAVIKVYGNLPLVNCYAGQLNQVFMNILVNAIDALEEAMTSNNFTREPKIFIRTELTKDNQVYISISDNGIGIPEHIQNKLFDPFFTTKPIGKGTGLGLSISYEVITERHKGKLQCISAHNHGTKFLISFPLHQGSKKITS